MIRYRTHAVSICLTVIILVIVLQPVYYSERRVSLTNNLQENDESAVLSIHGGVLEIPFMGFGLVRMEKPVSGWLFSGKIVTDSRDNVEQIRVTEIDHLCEYKPNSTDVPSVKVKSQEQVGAVTSMRLETKFVIKCPVNFDIHISDFGGVEPYIKHYVAKPYPHRGIYFKTLAKYLY